MVRFANKVGDAVLFVVMEMSLPELGGLVVVSGGVEAPEVEDCAAEGVGKKKGRKERRKRKSV